jgi:ectoine hydroxylase-related dioxygenase (phytanoyl-CoA dioxygenase family)
VHQDPALTHSPELFNILVNPLRKDYDLPWHRDDIKATASPDEELAELAIKHYGIQWNAALYDDACLSAVPGSHKRIRTPQEREANLIGGPMPGAQILHLKKGQTVFYNNNIRE